MEYTQRFLIEQIRFVLALTSAKSNYAWKISEVYNLPRTGSHKSKLFYFDKIEDFNELCDSSGVRCLTENL